MVQVYLNSFSGPLGLLLHLIREQEMDIFDIDIAKITQQYLDYIRSMKSLDLEMAGEFVAMAATLLQIKSRMLLPQYNEAGEEVEPEDPRKELVQRLIEYQKFQDAAKRLGEKPWVGRDWWLRGEKLHIPKDDEGGIELEENPLFGLISSYRKAIRGMKSGVHRVMAALQSVAQRIMEMKDQLVVGQRVGFNTLVTAEGDLRVGQILMTFLSLLELAKMGFVNLFQSENFAEIHVETTKVIDRDVLARVESYDNEQAEDLANSLMSSSVGTVEMVEAEAPEGEITPEELGLADRPEQVEMNLSGDEVATDEEIEAEEQRLFASEVMMGEPEAEGV